MVSEYAWALEPRTALPICGVRNHFSCGSGKSEAAAPGLFMTPMTFLTCLGYLSPAVDI